MKRYPLLLLIGLMTLSCVRDIPDGYYHVKKSNISQNPWSSSGPGGLFGYLISMKSGWLKALLK